MGENEESYQRRAYRASKAEDVPFRRSEALHQMLMADFRFMEAARLYSGEYEGAALETESIKNRRHLKLVLLTNPNGLVNFAGYERKTEQLQFGNKDIEPDIRSLKFKTIMSKWPPLEIWAHWLLNTKFFRILMVIAILINSVLIAVDQELSHGSRLGAGFLLELFDFFFLCLFVAEIILKWIDNMGLFWKNGWNIFDFLITALSLVPPIFDFMFLDTSQEESLEFVISIVKYLRIIRIFRSLNVVTRIHKIHLIWESVVKTFSELVFITVLMLIFFYIFAIIGIQIFERFSLSHLPDLEYRRAFLNLAYAFQTLFQIFTLDHYFSIVKEISLEQGYLVPVVYVSLWILLGSFVFNNIFTGVMVNNFQTIRLDLLAETDSMQQSKKLIQGLKLFAEENSSTSKGFRGVWDYQLGMGMCSTDSSCQEASEETTSKVKLTDLKAGFTKKYRKMLQKKCQNSITDDNRLDPDPLVAWEEDVFRSMQILDMLGITMSQSVWPRDTLFQYYIILEAIASNAEERSEILKLLGKRNRDRGNSFPKEHRPRQHRIGSADFRTGLLLGYEDWVMRPRLHSLKSETSYTDRENEARLRQIILDLEGDYLKLMNSNSPPQSPHRWQIACDSLYILGQAGFSRLLTIILALLSLGTGCLGLSPTLGFGETKVDTFHEDPHWDKEPFILFSLYLTLNHLLISSFFLTLLVTFREARVIPRWEDHNQKYHILGCVLAMGAGLFQMIGSSNVRKRCCDCCHPVGNCTCIPNEEGKHVYFRLPDYYTFHFISSVISFANSILFSWTSRLWLRNDEFI